MFKKQQARALNVLFSCFHYREGKYTCRCPHSARKPILPDKQLCNVTRSCWWSCYGYKEVLCGGHLHLWLGFDRSRGTLDVGRKDGKSFCHFINVKVKLNDIWSVFGESPNLVSDVLGVSIQARSNNHTQKQNKQKRSWCWPVEFPAISCKRSLHSPQGNETENKPNRWAKAWMWQGLSEILCPCTRSTKGRKDFVFSSQLLPLLFLKLHLVTNSGC